MSIDEALKWVRGLTMANDASSKALHLFSKEVERLRAENARLEKMLEVCSSVHGHNLRLKAELDWFRRRKVLSDELQSVYAALRDPLMTPDEDAHVVKATGALFDFDITKPGAGT